MEVLVFKIGNVSEVVLEGRNKCEVLFCTH